MIPAWLFRAGALMAGMVLIYIAYAPGFTGALYYDDFGNLEGLETIESVEDAYHFVRGGIAGPLGRPVALASFLPHAENWPDNSAAVLRANVLIHIANALLLGLLGYLILRLRSTSRDPRIFWMAFGAAFLWASLPLLASTSLIAIQRMTGLAALFGLLGLIGFVAGYAMQRSRPWLALILQMGALGLGTLLAVLSKENGALIPVFALLIDALLLRHLPGPDRLRLIRRGLLVLPLIAILVYLSPLQRDWFAVSDFRGFSAWERLQTQVVLLWEYLRLSIKPLPSMFGPFHDDRGIEYTGWISLLAFTGWIAVIGLGTWLYKRRNIVWPLFAVLWFLTGHLLESTTILLEIYFEHRNYLALYGFCLALTVAAFSVGGSLRRVAPLFIGVFAAIQLTVLASVTSLWGQPLVAASVWTHNQPKSARAVIHHVFLEMDSVEVDTADLNYQFIQRRRMQRALELLDRTAQNCPECLDVRLDALNYSCFVTNPDDTRRRMTEVLDAAANGKGVRPVLDILFRLRDRVNADNCPPLTEDDLLRFADVLFDNRFFAPPVLRVRLLFIAAALEGDLGNTEARDAYLDQAEQVAPVALPVLQFQIYAALREGDHERALAAIERRRALPRFGGAMTDTVLDNLQAEVLSAQATGEIQPFPPPRSFDNQTDDGQPGV